MYNVDGTDRKRLIPDQVMCWRLPGMRQNCLPERLRGGVASDVDIGISPRGVECDLAEGVCNSH